uniref:pentapeptide repeat-containing protein n=1 Tax=Actibacterium sp. TaxID=1872125 RepID=UPI0035678A92
GANLFRAEMQGADLSRAEMQGADLRGAEMQGANLSRAEMQGADLNRAEFDDRTSFNAATFQDAAVKEVDFTKSTIEPDQLAQMFGDASVTLPGGKGPDSKGWPNHWSNETLGWRGDESRSPFHQAWRAWQDKIGFDRQTNTLKHPSK